MGEKLNTKVIAASTDSNYSHLAWINTDRLVLLSSEFYRRAVHIEENATDVLFSEEGGLGDMDIPIISDTTHALSKAYGVLKEDEGIAYRGLFIIDTKGK